MANTVSNVTAGKPNVGGAIWIAPIGTTLPTDATTALAVDFSCLGYISEDGLVNNNTPTVEKIKAWGGDTVLTVQSDKEDTFGFTLLEVMNLDVLKFVYGEDNVTGTLATGITVRANSSEPVSQVMVIEMNMRDGAVKRIVLPIAKLSELGEITYADGSAVGYNCTVDAMPDASGNTHYEYTKRT